jgi:hypothetical protein
MATAPDDDARPDRPTRQRLANRVQAIGVSILGARVQLRALAPYFDPARTQEKADLVALLEAELDRIANRLIDLSAGVRIGEVPLRGQYLDDCRGRQPILDPARAGPGGNRGGASWGRCGGRGNERVSTRGSWQWESRYEADD